MIVLRRFLKDRRRSGFGWTVGLTLFLGLQNAFYPAFKEQMAELELPEGAGSFLGLGDIELTLPAGWLQGQIFALLPVLLAIFAISLGTRALATSEEDGTLELLLSNPIERQRVALERALGFGALTVAVGLLTTALIFATTPPLGLTEGVSIAGYVASSVSSTAIGLLFGGLAFMVGGLTGRRALSLTVGASAAVATYVMNGLSGTVEAAHVLRFFTPFHWMLGRNMLAQGIAIESLTLPFAFAGLFVVLGIWGFQRRDLRTG